MRFDLSRAGVTLTFLRRFVAYLLVGLCPLLSSCGGNIAAPLATPADLTALKAAAAAAPKLQSGDKIRVIVYGEPSLGGDFRIDPSGFVALPLAGTLKAAGLTPHQLEDALAKLLLAGKYLKNPKVTVEVTEFRPFYILGEVDKPGAYPYTSGLNVLSAIALAGGTTYRAKQSYVYIQHAGENEMHEYSLSSPIPIMPGDIIQIPRRYI